MQLAAQQCLCAGVLAGRSQRAHRTLMVSKAHSAGAVQHPHQHPQQIQTVDAQAIARIMLSPYVDEVVRGPLGPPPPLHLQEGCHHAQQRQLVALGVQELGARGVDRILLAPANM